MQRVKCTWNVVILITAPWVQVKPLWKQNEENGNQRENNGENCRVKNIWTHSVLTRRLMEFMQGGKGNVERRFISFSLVSVWGWGGKHKDADLQNLIFIIFIISRALILTDSKRFSSEFEPESVNQQKNTVYFNLKHLWWNPPPTFLLCVNEKYKSKRIAQRNTR